MGSVKTKLRSEPASTTPATGGETERRSEPANKRGRAASPPTPPAGYKRRRTSKDGSRLSNGLSPDYPSSSSSLASNCLSPDLSSSLASNCLSLDFSAPSRGQATPPPRDSLLLLPTSPLPPRLRSPLSCQQVPPPDPAATVADAAAPAPASGGAAPAQASGGAAPSPASGGAAPAPAPALLPVAVAPPPLVTPRHSLPRPSGLQAGASSLPAHRLPPAPSPRPRDCPSRRGDTCPRRLPPRLHSGPATQPRPGATYLTFPSPLGFGHSPRLWGSNPYVHNIRK